MMAPCFFCFIIHELSAVHCVFLTKPYRESTLWFYYIINFLLLKDQFTANVPEGNLLFDFRSNIPSRLLDKKRGWFIMNQLLFICEYQIYLPHGCSNSAARNPQFHYPQLVFFRNPNISCIIKLIFFYHMLLHANQGITVAIRYAVCKGICVSPA